MSQTGRRRHLILDLGGVIVDHDNALCYDRLIALLDNRPKRGELVGVIASSGVGDGSVTAEGLFAALRERYGSAATEAQFLEAWSCHFTLKEDVYRFLIDIKKTRPIVICSNTNAAHWNFLNERYGLDRLASKAILSHEIRCEKPKPEIYLRAAAAHGAEPHECLFVDDLAANIEGARALGFQTHHFTSFGDFRRMIEA